MGLTAKIIIEVLLKNRTQGLELLNKALNDAFEDLVLSGAIDGSELECLNLIVKEIVESQDGIEIDLYKAKTIDCQLIRTDRKEVRLGDLVAIGNKPFMAIKLDNEVNLYSFSEHLFYFANNLQSIQEITAKLEEKEVNYAIYIK